MKVAVMQPYFFPYQGYFNLINQVDRFVILDDVQFNRRGWVHRNKLYNFNNELSWLTLPLKKKPRDTTLIKDIEFVPNIYDEFKKQLCKFPKFKNIKNVNDLVLNTMLNFQKSPIEYLIENLSTVLKILRIQTIIIRASELNLVKEYDFQLNIINIVTKLGGNHYINLPGGKKLYDENKFNAYNLKLSFINEEERKHSILETLL
jgi:hypothetical protein